MTTTPVETDTDIIEEDNDILDYPYDPVEDFVGQTLIPAEFLTSETELAFDTFLEELREEHTPEEGEFDWEEYARALEDACWRLNRQRLFMALVMYADCITDKGNELSPWSAMFVKKMTIYSYSGIIPSYNGQPVDVANQKFHSDDQFKAAIEVFKNAPDEWRERMGKFIEACCRDYYRTKE